MFFFSSSFIKLYIFHIQWMRKSYFSICSLWFEVSSSFFCDIRVNISIHMLSLVESFIQAFKHTSMNILYLCIYIGMLCISIYTFEWFLHHIMRLHVCILRFPAIFHAVKNKKTNRRQRHIIFPHGFLVSSSIFSTKLQLWILPSSKCAPDYYAKRKKKKRKQQQKIQMQCLPCAKYHTQNDTVDPKEVKSVKISHLSTSKPYLNNVRMQQKRPGPERVFVTTTNWILTNLTCHKVWEKS